ncbi:RadC family protein [Miniphocaeibacter massiliensis]|uniref:RadC family protein n=1 Tax=Miniphocaeibacter massiliensis TaxID=2041841 RepID=UPI000C1C118D|nr:DNA repair protein RadC [Miniphocaeibacter massiliensis]
MIDTKNKIEYYARIKDLDLEDRPREKMILYGIDSLSDEELLAIIIGTGTKKHNAVELSKSILLKIKSQANHMDISTDELMEIKGVGLSKSCRILASLELGRRLNIRKNIQEYKINSPTSVANIFRYELEHKLEEYFYILLLDTKNKIISKEFISKGTLNESLVHPREVFKPAIKKSANSIILVHNHPSGDIEPSREDLLITERLLQAGDIIGIKVLDHLIIGDGQFLSFKEKKLFKE